MNLITKYMTANRCYLAGRTITIKGIMIHSTATRGVMAKDWFSRWNNVSTEVCVHAFVDDKEAYQYLPWNHRAWHCGGDGNNYLISIEMCEPKDINDKEYFKKVWTNTIELCVMLCKKYNLTEKDIIGHYEGYQKGIASNHGDPHHWFPLHGKNMNTFREELKKALNPEQKVEAQPATQKPSQIYRVRKAWADANSQIGAYTILQNAKNCVDKNKGYYVFNEQGKVVYPVTQSTKDYEKELCRIIVDGKNLIALTGKSKCIDWTKNNYVGHIVIQCVADNVVVAEFDVKKAETSKLNNNVLAYQKICNTMGIRDKNGNKLVEDGILGELTLSTVSKFGLIKKGNQSAIVGWIQEIVGTTQDNIFGNNTEVKVKEYQKKHKLTVDGIVGTNTLICMLKNC